MRTIVVGAGIMGLSTAWALSRDGHRVTVLEQGPIPNPKGSSVDAHRLIRHAYAAEIGYTRMVEQAYADWERLWRFLGERHYVPTGTLVIGPENGARIAETAETFARLGIPFERLDAARVASRFPVLTGEDIGDALHTTSGGVLLADRIVRSLAARLRRAGVDIRDSTRVAAVDPARARVTVDGRSGSEVLEADHVVVTAGPWVARLLPAYAGRVTPSRQTVAYLTAPADLRAAWRTCPMILENRERIGFYLVPPVLDTPLKVGDHGFTLTGDPDEERTPTPAVARAVAAEARHRLRGFDRYAVLGARRCFYTVEPQERFIVEPIAAEPGRQTWVATGFSGHGFKFGPTIGRAIADGIAGRTSATAVTRWAAGLEADA